MRQHVHIKNKNPAQDDKLEDLDLAKIISNPQAKTAAFEFVESLISNLYYRGRDYERMIKATEQENIDEELFS
ncbi:hypothetical protein NM74_20440 [Aeromonas hydrophila]|nr:hypothetical protein NM74_20440 [Aeromonas hydrophila]